MHKTQNSQTYFFHKFILLKDFFKKKRNPLFGVRLPLFLLGAYVKSLLLFLKCFLTRQFYEFSIHCCSFPAGMLTFLKIPAPFLYFSIRYVQYYLYECSTTLHSNIRGCDFHFSLSTFILHHISRQSTIITMV